MSTLTYSQLKAKAKQYQAIGQLNRMQTSIRMDWSEARKASKCGSPYMSLHLADEFHLVDRDNKQYYADYHVFQDGQLVGSAEIHEIHSSNRWS